MIPSWIIIGGITLIVSLLANVITPEDIRWFRRLRRPQWLFFESAIPIIWTVIFIAGVWSAVIIWEREPNSYTTWILMGCYLLLELAIIAYSPITFKFRSLKLGVIIGLIGSIWGLLLMIILFFFSSSAALLLLPHVIWSPIGTYTTWVMSKLNPNN